MRGAKQKKANLKQRKKLPLLEVSEKGRGERGERAKNGDLPGSNKMQQKKGEKNNKSCECGRRRGCKSKQHTVELN